MINKLKKQIVNNKYLFILLLCFFSSLVYCSLNTLIVNDDLGYSFLYRTSSRITNVFEVIKMQISDYKIVSSRVFIHSVVQILLIFGKNLWSFLNPFVIILNFCFINKIIKIYTKEKNNKLFNFVLGLICFLLIITYKWLIYWIAGSVNYVWTSSLIFCFLYLYLKHGLSDKNWINILSILIVSIIHESAFIFSVIFIIGINIYHYLLHKKIDKKKLLLFIPLIISASFLFLGPGTLSRMNSYSELSLFEKFNKSLPVVSFNLYNIKDINNLIPVIFVILTLLKLFKYKDIKKYLFILLNIICVILIFTINSNWLYFILAIIVLLSSFYINYMDNRNELSIFILAFYAICYSLCLTLEYVSGRPNYFIFIYMIFISILYCYDLLSKNTIKIFLMVLIPILFLLLGREIYIYKKIGEIKKERLNSIEKYKNNETKNLYYKIMDEKYYLYQMDLNEPLSKEYYAYKYFLDYYELPSDTVIELVD